MGSDNWRQGWGGRLSYENLDSVLLQLRAFGLDVESIGPQDINTAKPIKCKEINGDREKRCWYWLSDIELRGKDGVPRWYVTGGFGIYRGAENYRDKIKLHKVEISPEQRLAMAERHKAVMKRTKALREAEAKRAAVKAQHCWSKYLPEGTSPYLDRKQVPAYGLRFAPHCIGTFAVPMQDTSGRVWGLQIIRGGERNNKLEKEYWPKGLDKVGHFHLLGVPRAGGVALVAEGYATAATVHRESGHIPTAVAFDAGNLLHVAKALATAYPGIRLVIVADDDYRQKHVACGNTTAVAVPACEHCGEPHGLKNPGVDHAKAAAHAVGGEVLVPEWPFDRCGKKLTDFNDLATHAQGGSHHVRGQIHDALHCAGLTERSAEATAAAPPAATGEGGARRAAVSIMGINALVERFIPIDDGTGDAVFDTWTQRLVLKKQMIALLAAGLKLDDVKRHPTWISRGSYYLDEVGFDPAGTDTKLKINTWTGWPSEPKRGECELALDLLRHLVSGEENSEEVFDWILRWLAYPLQHPGAKMQTALVVHGPQGTGKSILFEAVAKIYGDYSMILNQGAIEDKFNSDWAARKLFVVADEIVARQDMHHIKNLLKGFITQEWIRVNPKNLPAYREKNHMNMVFLSNERQPLVLESDDRRHCVIWTTPPLGKDYYDQLGEELENGGIAALHDYLMNVELGDFKPWSKPPMTRSKESLAELGRPSVERFVRAWQRLEVEARNGDPLPFVPCQCSDLYDAYRKWCQKVGTRETGAQHLNDYCDRIPGWNAARSEATWNNFQDKKTKNRRMVVPDPVSVASAAVHEPGGRQPELVRERFASKKDWLTAGHFAFIGALSND